MIDFDKFIKYSKPGPRYTSYPTAVEFHENFKEADFANMKVVLAGMPLLNMVADRMNAITK
jgi:coproporphyrinogen III oxidase-like Fe-S oxidoreductase